MAILEGQKVVLRPVEKDDLELLLRWFNDPEIIQYLNMYLPMNRTREEKWLARVNLSETDIVLLINAKLDDGQLRPIGTCGLHCIDWKDRNAILGIAIGEKDLQNGGRGTETVKLLLGYAFSQLNLHRVNSSVIGFNERSLAMHKKAGFQEEGRRRKNLFKNGRYTDEIILGILREEWQRNQE